MKKFFLLGLLFFSFPSSANKHCKTAILKSVLFQINLIEASNDWSECQSTGFAIKCQSINKHLLRLKEETQKVHSESNKICAKDTN